MRLIFLGTSAAKPTPHRGLACTCLERNGEIIMFDAGEGAQVAYMKSGLGWNKKMRVLITHMHGDHCIGILGLLQTMTMQGRAEPLRISGPPGIEKFVHENVKILNFGLSFPVLIDVVYDGWRAEEKEYEIRACPADHTIMAFSYTLQEKERPGKFDREGAVRLGVPEGPMWSALQRGKEVVVGGRKVMPGQVMGRARPGRKVGISGDTRPSAQLERFFAGCDCLVFDSTFLESEAQKAYKTGHSTASQAAALAKNSGVKRLVLTHFSARYRNESEHLEEACRIHGSVTAAADMRGMEL